MVEPFYGTYVAGRGNCFGGFDIAAAARRRRAWRRGDISGAEPVEASELVSRARLRRVPEDDGFFGESAAAAYDERTAAMFEPAVVDPVVDLLAGFAGDGAALELAIGT